MSANTSTSLVSSDTVRPRALPSTDAATYVGVSPGHMANMRSRGEGPAYIRLSDSPRSAVVYLIEDLDDWLSSRRRVVSAGGDC